MPTGSPAPRPASVASSPTVKHRGRTRNSTGATRRTLSAHIQYEVLPAYTSTPRTRRPQRKIRSVGGEAVSKSARTLSYPGERIQESNTVPRRNKLTTETNENRFYRNYGQTGDQGHHGNQQRDVTRGMTAYQLVGYRAVSLPPQQRALSPIQGTTNTHGTPDGYSTVPRQYPQRTNTANYPSEQQGRVRPKSYHSDSVSQLQHAGHYQPDLSYPSKEAMVLKKDTNQPNNTQQSYNQSIQSNLYTNANDNLVSRSLRTYESYPTGGTLQAYPSTADGTYPYSGLHVNTGYSSPTTGGGPHRDSFSHSSPHEIYTKFSTHSEGCMPYPQAHSTPSAKAHGTPKREGSQPLLSHSALDRYVSPQALFAHLSNTDLPGSLQQEGSPPMRPRTLETYPNPDDIYTLPVRRSETPGPGTPAKDRAPHSYTQENGHEIPIKISYSSPRESDPPETISANGNRLYPVSSPDGSHQMSSLYPTMDRQYPGTNSAQPYNPYRTLQQRPHGMQGPETYWSPQAQYEHAGRLVDDPYMEEAYHHWDPDGSIHRMHSSSFHWNIFPHYTGDVTTSVLIRRNVVNVVKLIDFAKFYRLLLWIAQTVKTLLKLSFLF